MYISFVRSYCFISIAKMPQCIAYGCNNRSEDLSKGISFFRLPLKNPALLKTWIAKLRLENPPIKETSRICSAHFEDCFECDLKAELLPGTKSRPRLKPDAVPTIFSFKPQPEPRPTSTKRMRAKERQEVRTTWSVHPVFECMYHDTAKIYNFIAIFSRW